MTVQSISVTHYAEFEEKKKRFFLLNLLLHVLFYTKTYVNGKHESYFEFHLLPCFLRLLFAFVFNNLQVIQQYFAVMFQKYRFHSVTIQKQYPLLC